MGNNILSHVVFIKDPTSFPADVNQEEAIYALSKVNKLVILLSHGNAYNFTEGFILPDNVKLVPYSLDSFDSITQCVILLCEILKEHDIDLHSRYLDGSVALPLVLSGAILKTDNNTTVHFINDEKQFKELKIVKPSNPIQDESKWDLL